MEFYDKSYAIFLQLLFLAGALVTPGAAEQPAQPSSKILLNGPWALQSSCEVKAAESEISASGFKTQGWHRTDVPSTVVAALVADKTYPDPFFGMNLRSFPGVNYRIGALFSNLQMPDDSPFRCSWWYRTEFTMPVGYKEKTAWLHFDGINYRANVWLNGRQLADAKDMAGTFRAFEFDVSKLVTGAKENALAVEVFAPEKNSLAITWVDWNPAPPDKDMGLWKDVYLTGSGPVALRHPFVSSKLDAGYKTAELTVSAEVRNSSDHSVEGVLKAEIRKRHDFRGGSDAKGFPRSQAPPNRLVEVLVQLADGNTGTGRSGDIDDRHKAGYEIAQRSHYQLAQDHERTGITHKMRHIPQLSDYCPPSLVLSALDNALKRNGLVIASRSMDHSTRESCQSRDREIEPLLELGLTLSSNSKETSLRSRGFSREVAREKAHGAQPRQ